MISKKELYLHAWNSNRKNPKFTRSMLSDLYEAELGFKILISTISDLVRKQSEIMATDNAEFRASHARYPEMEECLYIFLTSLLAKKISVSETMLINKAKDFGH